MQLSQTQAFTVNTGSSHLDTMQYQEYSPSQNHSHNTVMTQFDNLEFSAEPSSGDLDSPFSSSVVTPLGTPSSMSQLANSASPCPMLLAPSRAIVKSSKGTTIKPRGGGNTHLLNKAQAANYKLSAEKKRCKEASKLADMAVDEGKHVTDRFRCMKCDMKFRRRYNLKVHMRLHTNELPYTCRVEGCGKRFKWRSSMAHHYLTHNRPDALHTVKHEPVPLERKPHVVNCATLWEPMSPLSEDDNAVVNNLEKDNILAYDPSVFVSPQDAHLYPFPIYNTVPNPYSGWEKSEGGNYVLMPIITAEEDFQVAEYPIAED